MNYLRTDQYTNISPHCPVRTNLHPADDVVEVTLGDDWVGEATLRLVLNDPAACERFSHAFQEAAAQLGAHLYAKANPDPAVSQLDMPLTAPIAS